MNKFCDSCHNLLIANLANETLTFDCKSCLKSYDSQPDDSLRFEDVKTGNLMIFNKILETAHRDPMNPRAYKKCKKCKHGIAKQIRLGKRLQLINICEKCQHKWSES